MADWIATASNYPAKLPILIHIYNYILIIFAAGLPYASPSGSSSILPTHNNDNMNTDNNLFESLSLLLRQDRSVRRFDNSVKISHETLRSLVGLTRYCSSGRNLQPLKYYLVTDARQCDMVFPLLAWAGYYKDWAGPEPAQRPAAYMVQCLDTRITSNCLCDDGLQLQAISLGATAMGLGGCIIKSFNVAGMATALDLPGWCKPLYVYALGAPAEKVALTDIKSDGDIKYFRDDTDRQCVPKRPLDDLLLN